MLTGEEELERCSAQRAAEVPIAQQHLLLLGAELGLRAGFDAMRLLRKVFLQVCPGALWSSTVSL